MRLLTTAACILTSWVTIAQHTFSIVAVDPATGQVGSAGASCIGGAIGVDIISGILPGRGGINAQAWVCVPNINLNNGLDRMSQGDSPQEVLNWLFDNDQCQYPSSGYDSTYRQYGVVDFDSVGNPRSAAFTGYGADDYKNHIVGANYAIQGNILLGQQILDSMEVRFLSTGGELADKLMAALQGANVPGADTRCLAGGTSSLSSYIKVAKPGDTSGTFYLDIVIKSVPTGVEPIDTLQTRFDAWKNAQGVEGYWPSLNVLVAPNPAHQEVIFRIESDRELRVELYSAIGERLLTQAYRGDFLSIPTSQLRTGMIYYRVLDGVTILNIGSFLVM